MEQLDHGAPFDPATTKTPETDRGFGDRRTVSARWEADRYDGPVTHDDRPANAVELSISHHKNSGYTITATAWTVYSNGNTAMQPFRDITRVAVVPAARYSRKQLAEVAAQALAAFPGNLPAGSAAAEAWERVALHHGAVDAAHTASAQALEEALSADPSSAGLPDFFEEAAAV